MVGKVLCYSYRGNLRYQGHDRFSQETTIRISQLADLSRVEFATKQYPYVRFSNFARRFNANEYASLFHYIDFNYLLDISYSGYLEED